MRHELARIGGDAEPLADAIDFPLKCRQIGRSRHAGPHRMRFFLAESADAGQGQREGRAVDAVERVGDLVGDMALDIADETQRQMIVFDIDPARPWQATPQKGQRKGGITRNFEGGEKTRHEKPPFLESKLSPVANHR